jgi:hypothetical protein
MPQATIVATQYDALAAVIYNDERVPDDDTTVINYGIFGCFMDFVPSLFVSRATGLLLLGAMGTDPVTVRLQPEGFVDAEGGPEPSALSLAAYPNPARETGSPSRSRSPRPPTSGPRRSTCSAGGSPSSTTGRSGRGRTRSGSRRARSRPGCTSCGRRRARRRWPAGSSSAEGFVTERGYPASTCCAKRRSSAAAGSAARPVWTAEVWMAALRGAVSQWNRSLGGRSPIGPPSAPPSATRA